jgi:uncharacterized membrane protein YeaQ/YmgE (transglycosylase-associated protein family)
MLLLSLDEDPHVWSILEGGIPMSLLELVVLLVIAGIAGAVAEFVVGFTPGGFLVSIIIGVIGAFIGSWLAHRLHLPSLLPITIGSQTIELVWTILGALVLVGLVSLLRGHHYPRRRYRYMRRRSYR